MNKAKSRDKVKIGTTMPRPVNVINLYTDSHVARKMVDMIIRRCPVPTFIPIFNNFVGVDEKNPRDFPNTAATILAQAAQILIFAPTAWTPDITYSPDKHAYGHRYPLPYGPNQEHTVGDRFSLEDLNRAIYMVFAFQNRRNGNVVLLSNLPAKKGHNSKWAGYHDPTWVPDDDIVEGADILVDAVVDDQLQVEEEMLDQRDRDRARIDAAFAAAFAGEPAAALEPALPPLNNLDGIEFHESVMNRVGSTDLTKKLHDKALAMKAERMPKMSKKRFRQVINVLKRLHDIDDPMEKIEQIKGTLTMVEGMVDQQLLDDYISKVRDDDEMIKYAQDHPGQMDALAAQLRKQAALEFFMSSLQPTQKHDLNDICDKYGLSRWPEIRLDADRKEIQPFKPHQVIGKPPPPHPYSIM
jgi:hypothetical protein